MEECIMEIMSMTRSMASVSMCGLMEEPTLVTGKKANKLMKECTSYLMVQSEEEVGLMDKEPPGLT
jgi:hypothetical protein